MTGDQHGPLTREVHEAVERALDEHRRDMNRFGWALAAYGPAAAWRWVRTGELPEIPEGEL